MNLITAQAISTEVIEQLKPFCNFIEVAGSTRRKCEDIGDIEIVLLRRGKDLIQFAELVNSWPKIKGEVHGRYTQRYYRYKNYDYVLDIFLPTETDYIRQYVIRTGSDNFSHNTIATAWVKHGWRGTKDGLRKENECSVKGKVYECKLKNPTLPPIWDTEESFFKWLNIPFVEPEKRI